MHVFTPLASENRSEVQVPVGSCRCPLYSWNHLACASSAMGLSFDKYPKHDAIVSSYPFPWTNKNAKWFGRLQHTMFRPWESVSTSPSKTGKPGSAKPISWPRGFLLLPSCFCVCVTTTAAAAAASASASATNYYSMLLWLRLLLRLPLRSLRLLLPPRRSQTQCHASVHQASTELTHAHTHTQSFHEAWKRHAQKWRWR